MTELLSSTQTRTTDESDRTDARQRGIEHLRAVLPGQVLTSGEAEWDARRSGWVLNVDQQPAAVVTVQDSDDVAAAVRGAGTHGLAVSAQPVGHGATGTATDTILLRTGALQQVTVDAARRRVRVEAGVKWGRLLEHVEPTGLLALAGSSPDPSVVGFTLGGGLSWFSRAFGLAAHSVTAFDLVDADGEQRHVTRDSDPDLFWALRGGGGDFGIVTAVEMELHEAEPVLGGRLMWPLEMAWPVLKAFRDITTTAPDALTCWAHLFRFPPAPTVPPHLQGKSFVTVDVTYLGAETELDELLAPLRSLPASMMDSIGPVPLSELGGITAEPVDPMPVMESSGLLHDLTQRDLDRLLAVAGSDQELPLAVVQLRHLGGALSRAIAEDGPSAGIEEQFQVFCLGVPVVPELVPAIEAGFAAVRTALDGQLSGRTFFNFLGQDPDISTAFTSDAVARLRRVKAAADPHSVIRSNRPVSP